MDCAVLLQHDAVAVQEAASCCRRLMQAVAVEAHLECYGCGNVKNGKPELADFCIVIFSRSPSCSGKARALAVVHLIVLR